MTLRQIELSTYESESGTGVLSTVDLADDEEFPRYVVWEGMLFGRPLGFDGSAASVIATEIGKLRTKAMREGNVPATFHWRPLYYQVGQVFTASVDTSDPKSWLVP